MRAATQSVTTFLRPALGAALMALGLAACAAPQPGAVGARPATAPQTAQRTLPAGPVRIALLAPFSGRESAQQAQARDLEAAARMALASAPAGQMQLVTYDTGADPQRAAAAAAQAVQEGAALILGPFYAQEALALGAAPQPVNALAFTPFSGAASQSVFVLGYAPENEVERILGYAAGQGLTRIGVVHPQSQYGDLVTAAAQRSGRQAGAQVVNTLSYPRSFQGVQDATASGAPSLRGSGADAVLIADGGQALESVAAFLDYHDVPPARFKYLGLAQWGEGQPQRSAQLVGGWFATVDPALRADFEQRFQAANGRRPTPVAALGYDAAAVAVALMANGGDFSRRALTSAPQFRGATGAFRFGPDGVVRRGLAVMEVQNGGPQVLEPAPATIAPAS